MAEEECSSTCEEISFIIFVLVAQAQHPSKSESGFEGIATSDLGVRMIKLGYKFGKIFVRFSVFCECKTPLSSQGGLYLVSTGHQ